MDGCFSPHLLFWLGLLLYMFLHYFILGISQTCFLRRLLTLMFFLDLFLGANALDLIFEEMQNIFDRGNLPFKIEIEHKEGQEIAHINDDEADRHIIDEILG